MKLFQLSVWIFTLLILVLLLVGLYPSAAMLAFASAAIIILTGWQALAILMDKAEQYKRRS